MRYEFFDKTYDDEGDSKARAYFTKMKLWISTATRGALKQLRRILEGSQYSKYLVEGSGSQMLLESAGDAAKIKEAFTNKPVLVFTDKPKSQKVTDAARQLKECFNGKAAPDKTQEQGKPATGRQIRELREALQTEKADSSEGSDLTLEESAFLNKYKLQDAYQRQKKEFEALSRF